MLISNTTPCTKSVDSIPSRGETSFNCWELSENAVVFYPWNVFFNFLELSTHHLLASCCKPRHSSSFLLEMLMPTRVMEPITWLSQTLTWGAENIIDIASRTCHGPGLMLSNMWLFDFDYALVGRPSKSLGLVLGVVLGAGGGLVLLVVAAIAMKGRFRTWKAYRERGEEWLNSGVSSQFYSIRKSDIQICRLPDGSPWILGSGAYGQVRDFVHVITLLMVVDIDMFLMLANQMPQNYQSNTLECAF